MAITTGIIRNAKVIAAIAFFNVPPERCCATGLDGAHDAALCGRQAIYRAICGAMTPEDVGHFETVYQRGSLRLEGNSLQWTYGCANCCAGDVRVNCGCCQTPMAQQELNGAEVGTGFQ